MKIHKKYKESYKQKKKMKEKQEKQENAKRAIQFKGPMQQGEILWGVTA